MRETPISYFCHSNLLTEGNPLPDFHDLPGDRRALMTAADRLADPRVADYFTGNGHRLAAARAFIDLMDLPPPDWAIRSPSGRAAVTQAAIARFKADNPDDNLPPAYMPRAAR